MNCLCEDGLFSRALSQMLCLYEHLANVARVEYLAPFGAFRSDVSLFAEGDLTLIRIFTKNILL